MQPQDEEDGGVASDAFSTHKSDNKKTKNDKVRISPQASVAPPKFLPSSKPLSAIATSSIDPAAAALADGDEELTLFSETGERRDRHHRGLRSHRIIGGGLSNLQHGHRIQRNFPLT
jgi:hypothetical protein